MVDNYDYSKRTDEGSNRNNSCAPAVNQELGYYNDTNNTDEQMTINPDNNYSNIETKDINTKFVNNKPFEKPLTIKRGNESSGYLKCRINFSWFLLGSTFLEIIMEIVLQYINIFSMIYNIAIIVVVSLVLIYSYCCSFHFPISALLTAFLLIAFVYGFFANIYGFFQYYHGNNNFIMTMFFILYVIRTIITLIYSGFIIEH